MAVAYLPLSIFLCFSTYIFFYFLESVGFLLLFFLIFFFLTWTYLRT